MIIVKGGVTKAKGFVANGVSAGIKKSGKKDLAILYSEIPAVAAAGFTANRFQASPVKVSKIHLKNRLHQAVIVNSGNANCMNGTRGDKDAFLMAGYAAAALGLKPEAVLVASTGIIGRDLPIEKIKKNTPSVVCGLSEKNGGAFSEAILTTDTVKKEFAAKLKIGSSVVTIGGTAKGVGMMYPAMQVRRHATMLCFITTDAAISKKMLANALDSAIEDSFNMISVDGDMSTNDTCIILANALAGNRKIKDEGKDYCMFVDGLKYLTRELAKKLAADGEGATKFVTIKVIGAKNVAEAKAIARQISTSNLLKCCLYGEDPNWGRIAAASGSGCVEFDPDRVDIYLGDIKVVSKGERVKTYDHGKARKLFKAKDIYIKVDLNAGHHSATAWTCDFSKEYVAINSEYST